MLFRTDAQKRDLVASWHRPDRSFFASGACHILTHEFLRRSEAAGFRPFMMVPEQGFRGGHIFASDGTTVFDYHGWSGHDQFVEHFFRKMGWIFPGWSCALVDISLDFWTPAWFEKTNHRIPRQFHLDPTARANAFIDRYISRKPAMR